MDEYLKRKFSSVMYILTKNASYYDLKEYLNINGINDEDWDKIKIYLKENYNVRTYE